MIRVGLIGANPNSSWAGTAHVPALAAAGGYEITAVATRREESARAGAEAYGAPRWFTGPAELAEHPEVDLVVVAVRAPGHLDATRAAIAAGKHVLVEWPLAVTADDAADLAAAADAAGVVHAVVAQSWHSPGAQFVAEQVAAGRIGTVEAVSFVGSGDPLGGSRVAPFLADSLAAEAGNHLLSIMGGHAVAALDRLVGAALGDLAEVSAVAVRPEKVTMIGSGDEKPNDVATHIAFVGRYAGGVVATVSLHGGNRPAPDGFHLRITGSDGALTITPRQPGEYVNWADWQVRLAPVDGEPEILEVPAPYGAGGGVSANLAHLYRDLAAAITDGRPAAPDFHTAARVQRIVAAVERSVDTGTRQVP